MRHAIIITLVALLILGMVSLAVADPVLRWSPSNTLVSVGDQTTISVMLAEPVDIRTIEIRLAYDPEVVESIDGEAGALFDGFGLFTDFENTSPGFWHGYCVILGANDWTTGPGELFRWTVAGVDTGTTIISTTTLNLLPPGGGDYPDAELPADQIRVDVPIGVLDGTPQLPALSLYPNPFNPRTRLELLLPGGGSARLEVLDVRGRVVSTPWSGDLPADQPVWVDWTGVDQVGRPLPSGVYVFRLWGGGERVAWQRGVLVR